MSINVVIIDDEKWSRGVIRRFIPWNEMGLSLVGEASDGMYGLELIDQLHPDIILTDVKMPRMDGIELLSHIRKNHSDACVIIISGYNDYSFVRDAMRLGGMDYLLKPIKQAELMDALQRCLQKISSRAQTVPSMQSSITLDQGYYALREDVSICLKAGNIPLLEKRLQALAAHLSSPSMDLRSNLVAVYCSLTEEMQKIRLDSGLTGNTAPPYVFSTGTTAEQMISYIGLQLAQTLQEINDISDARRRISISDVKEYIDANWQNGITQEQVAAHFGLSQNYLSKAFRASEQMGFSEYVIQLRMEHARRLILDYRLPLKEVGAQVGYTEQANFYKRFRAYFGMTPGEMLAKDDNEKQ